ncbi:MAG: hypothetical protein ACOCP8_05095, partial [archaeon]
YFDYVYDFSNFAYSYFKDNFDIIYKTLNFIDDLCKSKNIDMIVMWNHVMLPDCIVKLYCDKINKDVKTIYFENGYFRPNTITMDTKGVNYDSSVPRNKSFYFNIEKRDLNRKNNKKIKKIKLNKLNMFETYLYKFIFWFKSLLFNRYKFFRLKHTFGQEVKNKLFRKIYKLREEKFNVNKKYIFIPFQVHDDSQIIKYSPNIDSMEELVDKLYKTFCKLKSKGVYNNVKLVFKEHPMDIGRINYHSLYKKYKDISWMIFLKKYNTLSLIKNAEFILTINSTVGIEALQLYKPVLTLGNTFYNIEELVINNSNLEYLETDITRMKTFTPNKKLTENFLYYLKNIYHVKANWNSYDIKNNINVIKKIREVL